MPRKREPARLYYHSGKKQWIIRDGTTEKWTGYGFGGLGAAEAKLEEREIKKGPAGP